MSKPKKVWLSRGKSIQDGQFALYELWTTKPRKSDREIFTSSGKRCRSIDEFCQLEFESITGFSLSPGECKRVTIEIKMV